jgi:hypothetical protein
MALPFGRPGRCMISAATATAEKFVLLKHDNFVMIRRRNRETSYDYDSFSLSNRVAAHPTHCIHVFAFLL